MDDELIYTAEGNFYVRAAMPLFATPEEIVAHIVDVQGKISAGWNSGRAVNDTLEGQLQAAMSLLNLHYNDRLQDYNMQLMDELYPPSIDEVPTNLAQTSMNPFEVEHPPHPTPRRVSAHEYPDFHIVLEEHREEAENWLTARYNEGIYSIKGDLRHHGIRFMVNERPPVPEEIEPLITLEDIANQLEQLGIVSSRLVRGTSHAGLDYVAIEDITRAEVREIGRIAKLSPRTLNTLLSIAGPAFRPPDVTL